MDDFDDLDDVIESITLVAMSELAAGMRKLEEADILLGCPRCGHISCVCGIIKSHKPDCLFRKAATCSVGIECEHGYDVCPKCDPCFCGEKNGSTSENEIHP